ncbi:MAG: multifunctional oxoglutarate decarboxylase/oxoglutarate dehydrogenase thiamine pyrophosphate-binding subunit/dihydrolipoyllysine-residue succinyltransferase subunit, partial [Rhodoluna sp.]|nr:multifunctional oxoglutarate decarboxylase/oxoglutarate dehydrogenase thiamine pyrophosphate-binding subunit/dihydrolipoyllysine-residue succinyltransferase subunit [Rhodoluna sp.]
MYEQYKVNPDSVDKEWWPILERYHQNQGSTPAPAAVSAPAAPVSAPAAPATAPMVAKTTRIEPKAQPIPAQAPVTESITTIEAAEEEAVEDQINVLKGMSKALASNMDASIKVPTATSVRTIPAKLLIDNRIV